jgi:thiol-disulfide isomerase/thioredoxin
MMVIGLPHEEVSSPISDDDAPHSTLIQEVVTMEDYKTVVVDEEERMLVVRFFAPWCRACKAVARPSMNNLRWSIRPVSNLCKYN